MILKSLARTPSIHPTVYVDPTARINGEVTVERDSSIWFQASIRGDLLPISIGERTSIQDNCVLHTTHPDRPLSIGSEVVVGHGVVLHGCTVECRTLIGMGSVLMDGCVIEEDVVIGAGSLVTEGKIIPGGYLALGSPARPVRPLTPKEIQDVRNGWRRYDQYLREYRRQGKFHGWADHPLKDR